MEAREAIVVAGSSPLARFVVHFRQGRSPISRSRSNAMRHSSESGGNLKSYIVEIPPALSRKIQGSGSAIGATGKSVAQVSHSFCLALRLIASCLVDAGLNLKPKFASRQALFDDKGKSQRIYADEVNHGPF